MIDGFASWKEAIILLYQNFLIHECIITKLRLLSANLGSYSLLPFYQVLRNLHFHCQKCCGTLCESLSEAEGILIISIGLGKRPLALAPGPGPGPCPSWELSSRTPLLEVGGAKTRSGYRFPFNFTHFL